MPERMVNRVRILTEEQIQNLSPRSLRSYKKAVQTARWNAHDAGNEWCCQPKGPNCCLIGTRREKTAEEIEAIRAFDYACAAVRREIERRGGLSPSP